MVGLHFMILLIQIYICLVDMQEQLAFTTSSIQRKAFNGTTRFQHCRIGWYRDPAVEYKKYQYQLIPAKMPWDSIAYKWSPLPKVMSVLHD